MVAPRQRQGFAAEVRAADFLCTRGLALIARNVRFPEGEIDLVMREGAEWVFVEVRARSHAAWGGALASVAARKQARIAQAAQRYLLQCFGQQSWPPCRFDVVAFEAGVPHWVRGAFAPG